jgi:hypothetical protein
LHGDSQLVEKAAAIKEKQAKKIEDGMFLTISFASILARSIPNLKPLSSIILFSEETLSIARTRKADYGCEVQRRW